MVLPWTLAARHIRLAIAGIVVLLIAFYTLSSTFGKNHEVNPTSLIQSDKASSGAISQLCKSHGFKPFKQQQASQQQGAASRPRKVYDLFLLSTELDFLEIRLNTLAPYVDYFVIVEAPTTFTGLEKPLYLENAWENFTDFHDQIIHRVVRDPGSSVGNRVWDHEDYMRNSLVDIVFPSLIGTEQEVTEGDVLVISDVDEIPKPATLQTLRHCEFPDRLTLRSHFYYYSFQWRHHGVQWQHPQATTYRGASTIPPQNLRSGDGGSGIFPFNLLHRWWQKDNLWSAAWHCSSCFATLREMRGKMESFSHTSYNTPENRDPQTIVERVRNGLDLFGRWGENYDRVDDNRDLPGYLLQNQKQFGYMLNRDGEDAGFSDVKDFEGQ